MPPVPDPDLPFRHFSRKQLLLAWVSRNLFDRVTYTVRHGLLRGMKRKGGLGWVPAALSQPIESAEYRFWSHLAESGGLAGRVVFDVGAFHGLLTLFFARHSSQVVCYEPNTANCARLRQNLSLNRIANVQVRQVGLGATPGSATMAYAPLTSGGATLHRGAASHERSEEVSVTTLDMDIAQSGLPQPDFVKIDVEGWEIEVLKGARGVISARWPDLFLEMHGETMGEKLRNVAEIVSVLRELGYDEILHVESGTMIGDAAGSGAAAQGHLYCRRRSKTSLPAGNGNR